jgi:hypothetical protein
MKEAHAFGQDVLGLAKGRYRVVTSASSIPKRQGLDLYLVPGHEKRYDRFSIKGALRYTKMNVIDAADMVEAPVTEPAEVPDGLTPPGVQDSLLADFEAFLGETPTEPNPLVVLVTDGEHETEESLREADIDEIAEDVEPATESTDETAEVEQAEEPVDEPKRRRRRCAECGILVEPDEVEQHAAEHLPTEE